jgi:hypothetical protein
MFQHLAPVELRLLQVALGNVKVFIGGAAEESDRETGISVAAPVMKTVDELNRTVNFGYGD